VHLPTSEHELTELFRQLGASSPEQWAHSQVTEGIPQLLRFLFLKHAWSKVIPDGNTDWIEREISSAKAKPHVPYAGLGLALARCRAAGAKPEDLTEIARCLQAQMLFSMAYLIDGPLYEQGLGWFSWGLFEMGEDRRPIGPQVGGLHESVLELDPTGREMRPRDAGDNPPTP
jgi:hypothetical protein